MAQFNPTVPVYGALGPSIQGLYLTWASNKTITVSNGSCTDSTGNQTISVSAPLTTINGLANGLNGLDTGSLIASTYYAVFVIADPSGGNAPGFLLSRSGTNPILPAGIQLTNYGIFRRIGWIRTDGSVNFRFFVQEAVDIPYRYMQYDSPISVLSGGTSTSFVNVSLTTAVPNTGGTTTLLAAFIPAASGDSANYKAAGATNAMFIQRGQVGAVTLNDQFIILPTFVSGVPNISYSVSAGSTSLSVIGYFDTL